LNKGDRIFIQKDLENSKIKYGQVCTLIEIYDDSVMIRHKDLFLGVPLSFIRRASRDEIDLSEKKDIVDFNFLKDKCFIVNKDIKIREREIISGSKCFIEDFELEKNEINDVFHLKFESIDFKIKVDKLFVISNMESFNESFHDFLGEEVKIMKKNYFLKNARMKLKENGEIVCLLDFDNDRCLIRNLTGQLKTISKFDLDPIKNYEELLKNNYNSLVLEEFKSGKKYIALENIELNTFLKNKYKVGEIYEVIKIDLFEINFLMDSILLKRTDEEFDFDKIKMLKVNDIKKYFELYSDSIKIKDLK
jgi:hypothetical protein